MIRRLIILLVFGFTLSYANAQSGDYALPAGGQQLNFGLPGYIGMDWAVMDEITVGAKAQLGIFDNNDHVRIGVVADYHFNGLMDLTSDWDVYAGLSAGYRFHVDGKGNDDFDIGGQIGGRWFWNESWGLNIEGGFSGSVGGGLGVTWRM